MSKELIERLRSNFPTTQAQWEAADRIEELERAVEFQKKAWTADLAENDALLADNARLLDCLLSAKSMIGHPDNIAIIDRGLAATPAQSLARLRNQVREECAGVCDRFAEREMHPAECAAAIRTMKEPE